MPPSAMHVYFILFLLLGVRQGQLLMLLVSLSC